VTHPFEAGLIIELGSSLYPSGIVQKLKDMLMFKDRNMMGLWLRFMTGVSVFCLLGALLSACALYRTDLVKNGTVRLDLIPWEDDYITDAYAYQDGDVLEVGGYVASTRLMTVLAGGHVDLDIVAPGGEVLRSCVSYFSPILQKSNQTSFFYARFHLHPPKGVTVRMVYRHTTSPEELLNPCNESPKP
jgi:hypothetical protein